MLSIMRWATIFPSYLFVLDSEAVSDLCMWYQEAAHLVKDIHNPQKAAARLADAALNRGSNDNISCVVIRFEF